MFYLILLLPIDQMPSESASNPSTNSAIILKICQLGFIFDSDHLRSFDILIESFIFYC
jgi:hypothetical protein